MVLGLALRLAAGTGAAIVTPILARETAEKTQVIRGVATPETVAKYRDPKVLQSAVEAEQLIQKTLDPRKTQVPGLFGAQTGLYVPIPETLVYHVPGARAFKAQEFQSTMTGFLQRKGYPYQEARAIAKGYQELYRAESAGEATATIGLSAMSEAGGAKISQKLLQQAAKRQGGALTTHVGRTVATRVALGSGIAGAYEAGSMETSRQLGQVAYRGERFKPEEIGVQAAVGAGTAGLLGGAIGGLSVSPKLRGRTAGRVLEAGAYGVDPYELPGDILARRAAQPFGKGTAKEVSVPISRAARAGVRGSGRVSSFAEGLTSISDQIKSEFSRRTGKKGIYGRTSGPFVFSPVAATEAKTLAQARVISKTSTEIATKEKALTPADIFTQTPTETPTETITETPTETPSKTPTTATTPTETPSETLTETPTETPTFTSTFTTVPVTTTTPTPKYPFRPPLIMPPLFGGSEGGAGRGRKGPFTYYSEISRAKRAFAALNPVAIRPVQGRRNNG